VAVALVGAGLAISGAVFQSTFRNPLVSESILGVSEGAAVGAAIAILLSQSSVVIELSAFAFGVLAVTMTYQLSRTYRSNPTLVLVLAGIIVGSLFASVISLIKYVADPYTVLPSLTYWLLGSFANVSANDVLMVAPVLLGCISILLLIRWRLNVLSMGDEEARTLGIDTQKLRLVVIACATLATAACVSISGLVGWVGLVIPQIARMVVGPNHKVMLPATVLIGASYLLVIDTICRDLTTGEIPISIVTGIIGAPIFMLLLKNATQSWA
jgi:iron complex transport system permease protein